MQRKEAGPWPEVLGLGKLWGETVPRLMKMQKTFKGAWEGWSQEGFRTRQER